MCVGVAACLRKLVIPMPIQNSAVLQRLLLLSVLCRTAATPSVVCTVPYYIVLHHRVVLSVLYRAVLSVLYYSIDSSSSSSSPPPSPTHHMVVLVPVVRTAPYRVNTCACTVPYRVSCRNSKRLELLYVHSSHGLAPAMYDLQAKYGTLSTEERAHKAEPMDATVCVWGGT